MANKYMKISHTCEKCLSKQITQLQITRCGEIGNCALLVGIRNGPTTMENRMKVPQKKKKIELVYDTAILFLKYCFLIMSLSSSFCLLFSKFFAYFVLFKFLIEFSEEMDSEILFLSEYF